jgi:ribosomal protein L11 methyltransferase
VAATQANAAANDVADRVTASTTPLTDVEGTFELVVANIGVRVLTDAAAELDARVVPGGRLVLSGLLDAQADAVVARYASCEEEDRPTQEGWSAPVLRRRGG